MDPAETKGFVELAGREGFVRVHAWNGGPSNDDAEREFPRILAGLPRRGYPVDTARVHAAGFSAASDATGGPACAHPDLVAAVAPLPGGNLFARGRWYRAPDSYHRAAELRVPLVCVAGTADGGDRHPLAHAVRRVQDIVKRQSFSSGRFP